jgi:hypothetical protein
MSERLMMTTESLVITREGYCRKRGRLPPGSVNRILCYERCRHGRGRRFRWRRVLFMAISILCHDVEMLRRCRHGCWVR